MVKRLLILFISIAVGTLLAFFAVLYLGDYMFPVCCIFLFLIFGGFFLWIARGGLKKKGKETGQ